MIRTLIVDDERLSRERLRGPLAGEPDVEIVGEFDDGCQAAAAIEEYRPDLVFLEVQVPSLDGFQILERVGPSCIPAVVFVTSSDRHALRALDVRAVDYILKPFANARLQTALGRVRDRITREKSRALAGQLVALLEEKGHPKERYLKRVMIKEGGRIFFVPTPDIDWVEASGNYVRLHVGAESHLVRQAMKALERRLDPEAFLRIHRSAIVNIERIKELRPLLQGDYSVVLRDDRLLTMSATYRERLGDLR